MSVHEDAEALAGGLSARGEEERAALESMVLDDADSSNMQSAGQAITNAPAGLLRAHAQGPPASVSVSDPVVDESKKTALGTGAFVTYLISTQGPRVPARAREMHGAAAGDVGDDLDGSSGAQVLKVRRRFKDVVLLADVLARTLKGFAVPPRPEKAAVEGRFGVTSRQFAEERRRDIEAYLRRLVKHPAAGSESSVVWAFLSVRSAELEKDAHWRKSVLEMESVFLHGGGNLAGGSAASEGGVQDLSVSMQAVPEAPKQGIGARLFGAAARIGESARHALARGAAAPDNVAVTVPEAAGHAERIKELASMERALGAASAVAERYIRSLEESSSSAGDFGLSMLRLGKLEETCASKSGRYTDVSVPLRRHAEDCRRAGSAAVRSSRVQRHASDQCAIALGALHEHLLLCPSVRSAFQRRTDALRDYETALTDSTIAKRKLAAFEAEGAGPGAGSAGFEAAGRAAKQVQLSSAVDLNERAIKATSAALDVLTARNDEEWQRWQSERSTAMCKMLWMLARVHAETAERSFRVWLGAAEELKEEA